MSPPIWLSLALFIPSKSPHEIIYTPTQDYL